MKAWRILTAAFLATTIFIIGSSAVRAGLIHNTVEVTNGTSFSAEVYLYTQNGDSHRAFLTAGATHTFDVGKKCPARLKGTIFYPNDVFSLRFSASVPIQDRCTGEGGIEGHGIYTDCPLRCEDSQWKITPLRESSFHFDRQ